MPHRHDDTPNQPRLPFGPSGPPAPESHGARRTGGLGDYLVASGTARFLHAPPASPGESTPWTHDYARRRFGLLMTSAARATEDARWQDGNSYGEGACMAARDFRRAARNIAVTRGWLREPADLVEPKPAPIRLGLSTPDLYGTRRYADRAAYVAEQLADGPGPPEDCDPGADSVPWAVADSGAGLVSSPLPPTPPGSATPTGSERSPVDLMVLIGTPPARDPATRGQSYVDPLTDWSRPATPSRTLYVRCGRCSEQIPADPDGEPVPHFIRDAGAPCL